MGKIKIGAVNYLNAKPLIYGLKNTAIYKEIDLIEDYPAHIAEQLLHHKIDVGLLPVAAIPAMKKYYIITNYGIACNGEVGSVCLFSEVPIYQIKKIRLDYQSRTSVTLVQILAKEYWKIDVTFEQATENFREQIKSTTAAVVIGDRAFEQKHISPYCYDLGLAWKQYTNLPFVFATWVSNKALPNDFIHQFTKANQLGLNNIDAIVQQINYSFYNLKKYFTQNIHYILDDNYKKGLQYFLGKI